MKTLLFFFFACFSVFSLHSQSTISTNPKKYTSAQLRKNIAVFASGFDAQEQNLLVSDNSTGIFNAYLLNKTTGKKTPLTQSTKESYFSEDFVPGSNTQYLVSHDIGGDENSHLYLKTIGNGAEKDITPWSGSTNSLVGWSKDKKYAYVSSNRRNPKYFDLLKMSITNWKPELLYQNDSGLSVDAISPSERYLTLSKNITTDKNEYYLFDRQTKTSRKISNDSEATWGRASFEKNSQAFYYITNDGSEFAYVMKYDIPSGKAEKYFEDKWDVVDLRLSENEKFHRIRINEDGQNRVLLFDHKTNSNLPFPEIAGADVLNVILSPSEKNISIAAGSSTSPANIYAYNFESKKLTKLTTSLNKEIDENDLVSAEIVRFKSFDGLEIPAIYYKPKQATANNKVGALVWVHGGPGGQSRAGFDNSIQFLVNHGYAVLAVNNRGSSGYGRSFFKMDNRDHGNADLKDCIAGKNWLATQDYIDKGAIGIYGGSYGGNMVLNALAKHPNEFNVGVNLFGVTNWIRTLRSIPPYWEDFKNALYDEMGDPGTADSVRLKASSPLFNYQTISKPLIVFQGSNDVRVLPVESDEIVEGVKKNGVPVEYVVYPDEGHGFLKKENQVTTDERTLAFLQKYLKVKNRY